MRIEYIAQPETRVGDILMELITGAPPPVRVVLVSAFAFHTSLVRMRPVVADLVSGGAEVGVVVGIDLGGTSSESLREILRWGVPAHVVCNPGPGPTFHAKVYWVERGGRVNLLIGSSNLTDGGLYTNYEAMAHIVYDLPGDEDLVATARERLRPFLHPSGGTCRELTQALIDALAERGDVVTEADLRTRRRANAARRSADPEAPPSPFQSESVPAAPPLPDGLLDELVRRAERARRSRRCAPGGLVDDYPAPDDAVIHPSHFYMTLPKMRAGPGERGIPGEPRVPLAARDIAPEFWGWPHNYELLTSPRGGQAREYWEWRPLWFVAPAHDPDRGKVEEVRMYLYANSADFRFYSGALLHLGADEGDIVRISSPERGEATFECLLARQGTPEYSAWLRFCTQDVRNSNRVFGYA